MDMIFNGIGLVGMVAVLVAYFQIQRGAWLPTELAYPMANLLGSLCIIVSLFQHWNLASFLLNTIWVGISLHAIFRTLRKKNHA